jgi:hypothetical protein
MSARPTSAMVTADGTSVGVGAAYIPMLTDQPITSPATSGVHLLSTSTLTR